MKKNGNPEDDSKDIRQIIGFVLMALSLLFAKCLLDIYRGSIKAFDVNIPILGFFASSLGGLIVWAFLFGMYLFTKRNFFLNLSKLGIAWFFYNFILIDIS